MINFDAVIFDLDGVITRTADVHAKAWKKMFDEYLLSREDRFGEPFKEFTNTQDYLPYVDGKPRYKGVASFLESRSISIPEGDPSDSSEAETICGLGNKKNIMFNKVLDESGAEVFESSVVLIRELLAAGVKVGVASSSKNCKAVLEKVDLLHLFETRIDGLVSAEIGLKGKPEPDIFTTACDRIGAKYSRSVVVEDAVSGVQAGRNGNFGLVIGVAREDNINELFINGADIVVEDLGEIDLDSIVKWFNNGINEDSWILTYYDYEIGKEKSREALLSVGNGYLGTRGALTECIPGESNSPGTYIAGLYNRLKSKVAERFIENEDLVNIINWTKVSFKIDNGEWMIFDPNPSHRIISIQRDLNLKDGELISKMVVEDGAGRQTRVISSRFVSMFNPHRGGVRYSIEALNYSGVITLRSELRGDHINTGVERYSSLEQKHLAPISSDSDKNTCTLAVRTVSSGIEIVAGARHQIESASEILSATDLSGEGWVAREFTIRAEQKTPVRLEKIVSIYTSLHGDILSPMDEVVKDLKIGESYLEAHGKSRDEWYSLWEKVGISVEGDREALRLVRLHAYHTLSCSSYHSSKLDVGIPPRGLTGEAYRGHIFWDELYILPFFNLYLPEVTKSVLMYRYRRLDEARKYAAEYSYKGAMFPWQSGSSGREETQVVHLNPLSGEWGEDYSSLQRHVSLAIAYNLWNYYHITQDKDFMVSYGTELLFDICLFWSSKCKLEKAAGRFHISGVMGPDEYHEMLPGAEEGGLTDNAYTNIMVVWMLERAISLKDDLSEDTINSIKARLGIDNKEMERWARISRGLALNISEDGIVEQFKGYFGLAELDWDDYRKRYDDIHRLDRILKAEGKSPDEFKLSKQADFLMTIYNLGEAEVRRIIELLGYSVPDDYFRLNYNYYIARTSHGSTLSRLVHSALAFNLNLNTEGWHMYMEALRSDLNDIQGGSTGEGIHCGVMTGTVSMVMAVFCGLNLSGNIPKINPHFPEHWEKIIFNFSFRSGIYKVDIDQKTVNIIAKRDGKEKIKVNICDRDYDIEPDILHTININ